MANIFDSEYKKLNEQQRLAVDTIDGPVLVIAGPGTGKTQLLSMRVANIIRSTDTDPSNILCLTFTNKAATNMRERLFKLTGNESRNVVVRTFHSLAAEIMNEYPDYFWNGARLSVAPDAVQQEIIQNILSKLPLDNPLASTFAGSFTALGDVQTGLKLAKEAGLTPEQLRAIINHNLKYLDKVEPILIDILAPSLSFKHLDALRSKISKIPEQKLDPASLLEPLSKVIKDSLDVAVEKDLPTNKTTQTGKWKLRWLQNVEERKGMFAERRRNNWWLSVADVYETYRLRLHERGYYDYSDMLIEVLEQLEKEPEMRADLQERFQYVLIDEFQDTNGAQLKLSHLIADNYASNNRPNLMAVGDDDQSIFAFNGAELNNTLEFRTSYPTAKLIVLADNYRSSQAVLDISKVIIEQADDRLVNREPDITKNLVAGVDLGGKSVIEHLSYPTREHQYSELAKIIKNRWQDSDQSIAVLARKHDSLRQLAAILLAQGIPIRYEQQSNILEHEALKNMLLIAKTAIAIAEGDKAAVNLGLAELLRHPMWQLSPQLLWKLAIANYSSPDWLESLLTHDDNRLKSVGDWLVWLARSSHEQPLALSIEYIMGLREGQYMLSPFRDYYIKLRPTSSEYLETLSAVELLRSMAIEFSPSTATLSDFVRFAELNLSTGRVVADESWFTNGERAVDLLTVYKAKGLEFDSVFIVDAIEAMWRPRTGGRTSPANLRLQSYGEKYDDYVRLLYVAASRAKQNITATSYFTDEKGNQLLPTPLLSALPLNTVKNPQISSLDALEENLRWPHLSSNNEKSLLKDRLENYSLSSTALINFLNVAEAGPDSFMERHLLRLPTPRSAQGSYGSAIHAALETAQRLVNTSTLKLDTVMDRFEAALIEESLPPIDYERYRMRGEQLLTRLFKNDYLKLEKGGLSEQHLKDIVLRSARLNGKLDRINIDGDSIMISDYKTGKPLSSFDTHDQTKTVKAWRHRTQLLFYGLLISQSSRFSKVKSMQAQMIYLEAEKTNQLYLTLIPDPADLDRLAKIIEAAWQHIMQLSFPATDKYSADIQGIKQFEQDLIDGKI